MIMIMITIMIMIMIIMIMIIMMMMILRRSESSRIFCQQDNERKIIVLLVASTLHAEKNKSGDDRR